jgi:hypothetical protein
MQELDGRRWSEGEDLWVSDDGGELMIGDPVHDRSRPGLADLGTWADFERWLAGCDDVREDYGPINAQITADYMRLSNRMRAHLGLGTDPVADWCGFAAWVSELLSAHLSDVAGNRQLQDQPWIRQIFILHVRPRLLTVGHWRQLAKANFCIYREMRAIYELVWQLGELDFEHAMDVAVERTDALMAGPVFAGVPTTPADRYWARHAVRSFLLAAAAEDRQSKAEYILSASIALSAVEQRRADEIIDGFFEGMVTDRRWLPPVLSKPLKRLTVRFTTRFLTRFWLPEGLASVGRPLPIPDDEHYPLGANPLDEVGGDWVNLALDQFWETPRPQATDWTIYRQRMAFIAALFRTYQHHQDIVGFGPIGPDLDLQDQSGILSVLDPVDGAVGAAAPQARPLFDDVDPTLLASYRPEPPPR